MAGEENRASFALDLDDGISRPSQDAASALEALRRKIADDTAALRGMQSAMRNMKGATGQAKHASMELKDRIDAQKASIAAAQATYLRFGGTFGPVARQTRVATVATKGHIQELRNLPGPLGALGARLTKLVTALGSVAGVIGLVVGALAALGAALGGATAALLRYGVAQSDARRSELLRLEGLTSIRTWYGRTAGSAAELQQAIDRVSEATGTGRSRLEGYTSQLYRMGLRGEALSQALEGMAIVGEVQGERMARRFAGMAAGAARTGGSVRRLADDVRTRLGGVALRRMMSLDNLASRLRESFRRIFGDLRLEGFLGSLDAMVRMFGQSTATGRALKTIVEALFNPILDGVGAAQPLMRRFFQGMILAAQFFTIQILRLAVWLRRTFGMPDVLRGMNAQRLALSAGILVVSMFVAVLITASAVTLALAAAVGVVAATVAVAVAPFVALYAAGVRVVGMMREMNALLLGLDWGAIGSQLVDGLVRGITTGAERVRGAVRGLAASARGALESALGIASPSRVFAELGRQLPAGLALGVEAGSGTAQDAVDAMVSPPAAGGRGGGTSVSISIDGGIHVHASSGEQAADVARSIADELANVLEGLGLSLGTPEPEGAS